MLDTFYEETAPEILLYYFPLSIPLILGLITVLYGFYIRSYWLSGYGFMLGMTFASQLYHYNGDVDYFPHWVVGTLVFIAAHLLYLATKGLYKGRQSAESNGERNGHSRRRSVFYLSAFSFICFFLILVLS